MHSEDRIRLAQQFLQLPKPGEKIPDAQKKLTNATVNVILCDFTRHIVDAIRSRGLGMPVISRNGNTVWHDIPKFQQLIKKAEKNGDAAAAKTFAKMISLLEDLNPEEFVIYAFSAPGRLSVFKLPIEAPAREIFGMLDQWEHGELS